MALRLVVPHAVVRADSAVLVNTGASRLACSTCIISSSLESGLHHRLPACPWHGSQDTPAETPNPAYAQQLLHAVAWASCMSMHAGQRRCGAVPVHLNGQQLGGSMQRRREAYGPHSRPICINFTTDIAGFVSDYGSGRSLVETVGREVTHRF